MHCAGCQSSTPRPLGAERRRRADLGRTVDRDGAQPKAAVKVLDLAGGRRPRHSHQVLRPGTTAIFGAMRFGANPCRPGCTGKLRRPPRGATMVACLPDSGWSVVVRRRARIRLTCENELRRTPADPPQPPWQWGAWLSRVPPHCRRLTSAWLAAVQRPRSLSPHTWPRA